MTFTTDTPHGDNGGPKVDTAFEEISATINDLYEEAKHWADGEPIGSADVAEAITALFDGLGAAGREAEALRVAEVKPLDEAKSAIQARFHPLIGDTKAGKGKVVRGRAALQALLTAWRTEQARLKEEAARKAREEADALAAAAQQKMRSSSGNLAEREEAEDTLALAKEADRFARRTERAATTGTGLRTVWLTTLVDGEAALSWAYEQAPERFTALVQSMAEEAVRSGARSVPGFKVEEGKKAA